MQVCSCPHCGTPRIVTSKVPRDVVVVMPCPNCRELVVLFRNKAVALSRKIMEAGTFEEKREHIAEIITEFFEPGMLGLPAAEGEMEDITRDIMADEEEDEEEADDSVVKKKQPISKKEFDEFVRLDLNRIDEAKYFKKYFG